METIFVGLESGFDLGSDSGQELAGQAGVERDQAEEGFMFFRRDGEVFIAPRLVWTKETDFSPFGSEIVVMIFGLHILLPNQTLALRATRATVGFTTRGRAHAGFGPGHHGQAVSGSQFFFDLLVHISHIGHHDFGQNIQTLAGLFQQGFEQTTVAEVGGFNPGDERDFLPLAAGFEDPAQGVFFVADKKFRLARFFGAMAFGGLLGGVFALALTASGTRAFFLPRPAQAATRSVESGTATIKEGKGIMANSRSKSRSLIRPRFRAPNSARKSERVLGWGT